MLGGTSPLLIFHWLESPTDLSAKLAAGIPDVSNFVDDTLGLGVGSLLKGVPIPIYLDEGLTGIVVDSHGSSMTIDTSPDADKDGGLVVLQRPVNTTLTVELTARIDSAMFAVLMQLSDRVFSKLAGGKYALSYFNGPIAIVGGLLAGFSTRAGSDDTLLRISVTLSKAVPKRQSGTTIPRVTPASGFLPDGKAFS